MAVSNPVGTYDLLPRQARVWERVKQLAFSTFGLYGYEPIETPLFEHTDLFVRGIGESTDVVSKEIFHVISSYNYRTLQEGGHVRSKDRFALRPEGTASVVRSVIQNDLVPQGAAPVKLMYAGPMYRAERPQQDRYREFRQIGVEFLGAAAPTADAELIIMLMRFYQAIGLPMGSVRVLINSLGDDRCRPAYREAVRAYIHEHSSEMCEDCNARADLNPLRAFDCKEEGCRKVMAQAPLITDALCDECKEHFAQVKALLDAAGVPYVEDPHLVRGLDYYTRTVFEVQVTDGMGAQNAIGGGGRYDKLVEQVGGRPTPGLGFALGFERMMHALEIGGAQVAGDAPAVCYVACADASVAAQAFDVMQALRDAGIACDGDHQGRSLKSQLKVAGRMEAPVCVVVGPDELAAGQVSVRDMRARTQETVALEHVAEAVSALLER